MAIKVYRKIGGGVILFVGMKECRSLLRALYHCVGKPDFFDHKDRMTITQIRASIERKLFR